MLSAQGLRVHVDLLLPQGARHADRRALAEHLRAQIHAQLHATALPAEAAGRLGCMPAPRCRILT